MITLLELLLNKKHKNILNFYINNIALPISEIDEKINHDDIANDDSGEDDEWDKEDFDPLKNIITLPNIDNKDNRNTMAHITLSPFKYINCFIVKQFIIFLIYCFWLSIQNPKTTIFNPTQVL